MTLIESAFIRDAAYFLENPGLLLKITNEIGKPIERALTALPTRARGAVKKAVHVSLEKGLALVVRTVRDDGSLDFESAAKASETGGRWHTLATFGTGAIAGLFGASSIPIELPITTGVMLRSIAATAREFGMDLKDPKIQLECLYVLALGAAPVDEADRSKTAYWASRLLFAGMIARAATVMSKVSRNSNTEANEPEVMSFLTRVAARFEIVVSEKMIAEFIPGVGALGGGLVNAAFTDYFNKAARFHFGLMALEKTYGEAEVRRIYEGA